MYVYSVGVGDGVGVGLGIDPGIDLGVGVGAFIRIRITVGTGMDSRLRYAQTQGAVRPYKLDLALGPIGVRVEFTPTVADSITRMACNITWHRLS